MAKTKTKHLYRVSVYLGKDLYNELDQTAHIMGVSVATLAKIMLNTGYELSKQLEQNVKKGSNFNNGKQQ